MAIEDGEDAQLAQANQGVGEEEEVLEVLPSCLGEREGGAWVERRIGGRRVCARGGGGGRGG